MDKTERDEQLQSIHGQLESITESLKMTILGKNDGSAAFKRAFRKRILLTMKRASLFRKLEELC